MHVSILSKFCFENHDFFKFYYISKKQKSIFLRRPDYQDFIESYPECPMGMPIKKYQSRSRNNSWRLYPSRAELCPVLRYPRFICILQVLIGSTSVSTIIGISVDVISLRTKTISQNWFISQDKSLPNCITIISSASLIIPIMVNECLPESLQISDILLCTLLNCVIFPILMKFGVPNHNFGTSKAVIVMTSPGPGKNRIERRSERTIILSERERRSKAQR